MARSLTIHLALTATRSFSTPAHGELRDLAEKRAPVRLVGPGGLGLLRAVVVVEMRAPTWPGNLGRLRAGMNRVVQIGKALARHGAAVIFVHHGTKAEGNTPRGHSVFNEALDFSIQVKAADQSGIVRGQIRKNRNGPADLGIASRIGTRHVGIDVDGELVRAPICEPLDPLDVQDAGPRLKPTEEAALSLMKDMAGPSGEVAETDWRVAYPAVGLSAARPPWALRISANRLAIRLPARRGGWKRTIGYLNPVHA